MCAIRNIDCLLKRVSRFTSVDHITVSKSDLEKVIIIHRSNESHPHIKLFWPFFALSDPKSHLIQMTEYHGRHNTAATKGLKIARWLLISGTFVCFLCHCHFVACLNIFNMITAISKYFSKFCEVSIDTDLLQGKYQPRTDNSVWQHAHQCNQAWPKKYGGCLEIIDIF